MRAPKIHALNKLIVSFGAAKRKQNNRSLLAVIFILFFRGRMILWHRKELENFQAEALGKKFIPTVNHALTNMENLLLMKKPESQK